MTKNADNSILEGLKLEKRRAGLSGFMAWRKGFATYTVRTLPSDRRVEKRIAVRLQSGKVLDLDGRFLCDFLFVNRGAGGVRISLGKRMALPRKVWLYEDLTQTCRGGDVIWQNNNIAGCRFRTREVAIDERLLRRFRTKYYALW